MKRVLSFIGCIALVLLLVPHIHAQNFGAPLSTIPHLKTPERFVSVAKEFALDETRYNAMKQAGTNPYQVAGLMTN